MNRTVVTGWRLLVLTLGASSAVPVQPALAQSLGVAMVSPDGFSELLRDSMRDYANSQPGTSIRFEYAENGAGAKQIEQVKGFIAAKVDAIIVLAVDTSATTTITRMAQEADVPLVYVNNGPHEDWFAGRVALVLPNDFVAGRLQMTKMGQILNGRGRIAIIGGPAGHSASQLRTAGVKEVAADLPGISIVAEAAADWDRRKAEQVVSGWLSRGEKIDAILANNDEMALGAANALQAAKTPREQIKIAGVDATPDGLKAMLQKRIVLTIQQDAKAEGQSAISNALKLINKEHVQQYDWVDFDLVTDKNISKFIEQ
ncbi:substrate-binding domain-containing protein [Methylobacterium terricola]|uniref:substrate-binding domain-containing protein n=1 Tax=Methylobacterium terricola TaxID=2583531 RepID=UPI0014870A78|nr:substrate-binding domain-containing protein [Methylobacterium terricola]